MEEALYVVVRNHELQYSIWMCELPLPAGWEIQGEPTSKQKCLDYIEAHWTNMTPASLRGSSR